MVKAARKDYLISPFVVVCDNREKQGFEFSNIRPDARDGRRPVVVPVVTKFLATGDYSIEGLEDVIGIERKNLSDLYGTIGQGRGRFERELQRLAALPHAFVVIEAEWSTIISDPPARSQLSPKSVFRSILAWQVRFPTIQWVPCPGRAFAEVVTYRLLERVWKEQTRRTRAAGKQKEAAPA